jgi:hypothetical protein
MSMDGIIERYLKGHYDSVIERNPTYTGSHTEEHSYRLRDVTIKTTILWFVNGKLHRDNGLPAIESTTTNNSKQIFRWYVHGKLHRVGGPAMYNYIQHLRGPSKTEQKWFLNGNEMTKREYDAIMTLRAVRQRVKTAKARHATFMALKPRVCNDIALRIAQYL